MASDGATTAFVGDDAVGRCGERDKARDDCASSDVDGGGTVDDAVAIVDGGDDDNDDAIGRRSLELASECTSDDVAVRSNASNSSNLNRQRSSKTSHNENENEFDSLTNRQYRMPNSETTATPIRLCSNFY